MTTDPFQRMQKRLRSPLGWIVVAGFVLPSALALASKAWKQGLFWAGDLLFPLLIGALYLAWAPFGWEWSDAMERPPSLGRGTALALLSNLVLMGLFWGAWAWWIPPGHPHWDPKGFLSAWLVHSVQMTLVGAVVTAFNRTRDAKARVEIQHREARWNLLKAQLHPHVLYNSLNMLAEMVRKDPVAEKAVLDLAAFYERMLDLGERTRAPLSEERLLLESYLAIEALRFGQRLRMRWEWDPALDVLSVPPLLLLPLVENALKHGLGPHPGEAELCIRGALDEDAVRLSVGNTGRPLPHPLALGVGLSNLASRLDLALGSKARLDLHGEDGWTWATLTLPRQSP